MPRKQPDCESKGWERLDLHFCSLTNLKSLVSAWVLLTAVTKFISYPCIWDKGLSQQAPLGPCSRRGDSELFWYPPMWIPIGNIHLFPSVFSLTPLAPCVLDSQKCTLGTHSPSLPGVSTCTSSVNTSSTGLKHRMWDSQPPLRPVFSA